MGVILPLLQTALELGLTGGLTVLALFLSYSMLNVCDLSTDGCFTLGAAVGAVVAIAGHPYLSILAAMGAGILSGLITAVIQTKMGVDSLLAGIIVNTGLYSINIAIMSGSSIWTPRITPETGETSAACLRDTSPWEPPTEIRMRCLRPWTFHQLRPCLFIQKGRTIWAGLRIFAQGKASG